MKRALGSRYILPHLTDEETKCYKNSLKSQSVNLLNWNLNSKSDPEYVTQTFFQGTKETVFILSQPLDTVYCVFLIQQKKSEEIDHG